MVDHLLRQFPGGTVTLQGAFADIEHLAQVVIIQQHITVGQQRPFFDRSGCVEFLQLVESLHDAVHPALEMFFVDKHTPMLLILNTTFIGKFLQ